MSFNGNFEQGVLCRGLPAISAPTIGTATGAALAFKQEGSDRVCVCCFGDGTANRGDFHENINLAAIWRLPIVYVCQNNGWAISQVASTYLAAPVAARAAGYGIPGLTIDGHDVEAVRATVREAVARARDGDGPTLIEMLTSRRRGHWAGHKVPAGGEADVTRSRDPLELFATRLSERGDATPSDLQQIHAHAEGEIAEAVERAKAAADVGPSDLGAEEVYA